MNEKNDITTPARPVAALWVNRSGNFTDAVSARRCDVLCYSADGFATIRLREGSGVVERHCNTADLASTPEKAAGLISAHLTALLSRPLQTAVAGMTESNAVKSTAA